VQVAIWGILTDADPQAAQRLRDHWQGYFLDQTHAAGVELRSADTRVRLARLERCLIIEEVERPTLGKPQRRVSVIRVAQGDRLI
jgi:hypothetical protein